MNTTITDVSITDMNKNYHARFLIVEQDHLLIHLKIIM